VLKGRQTDRRALALHHVGRRFEHRQPGHPRNQFAASQMALLLSFMPAMMLSGFVFDLRNVPVAIQLISQALPATHFMAVIKTLFLAGDYWPTIIRGLVILTLYAALLIWATWRTLAKKLD